MTTRKIGCWTCHTGLLLGRHLAFRFMVALHPSLFPFLLPHLQSQVPVLGYLHRQRVLRIRNSIPGTQQSVVTELVAIVKEEHLDIGGESGHVMARQVQDELVRSVLGQHCRSKAHPSCCDHRFHPFPCLGDGGDGFPFS